MNFEDTIKKYDYEVFENEAPFIRIKKKRQFSETVIVFDVDKKTISGILTPFPVMNTKEMEKIVKDYADMTSELKIFNNLSHYAIINV